MTYDDGENETENEKLIHEYYLVDEFSKCMARAEAIEEPIPASRPVWSMNDIIIRLAIAERFISKSGADSDYEDFKSDMRQAWGEIVKQNPELASVPEEVVDDFMDTMGHYLDEQAHGDKSKES